MKKLIPLLVIILFFVSCEKSSDSLNSYLTARIVGFDLNCSTCILEFPYDSMKISEEIGHSPNNYYGAINMNKNNFEIGQMLKVRIRIPEKDEIKACITLYESFNYKDLYVIDYEDFNNIFFGDTISLAYNDCLYDPENQIYLCLDSVVNDSRCPTGVYCFWEGNARVRFSFEKNESSPVVFDLNTHKGFTSDTVVYGYKISLLGLNPYPSVNHKIDQDDYKAELIIEKK